MKRFRFRLETLRRLREVELKQARRDLGAAAATLRRWDHAAEQAMSTVRDARDDADASGPGDAVDVDGLKALYDACERLDSYRQDCALQSAQALQTLNETQRRYAESRTRVELLERLRERRQRDWQLARDKQEDAAVMDRFSHRSAASGKGKKHA